MAVKVQTKNFKIYVLTFQTIRPNVTFLSQFIILVKFPTLTFTF
jgi:hypothetical protein